MKRLPKFILVAFLAIPSLAFAQPETVGEKDASKSHGISKEDIETMTINQNLEFLNRTDAYFENAVYTFEKIGKNSLDPLVSYLRKNRDEKQIVTSVIYTLGRLGKNGNKAVPVIMPYIKSDDYDIRNTSIAAMGRIGNGAEKAVPLIKESLNDPQEFTRTIALRALKDIGTPQSKAIASSYEKRQLLLKKREEQKNIDSEKN